MKLPIRCPYCLEEMGVEGQLVPGAESPRPISFYPDGMRMQSFEGHWWGVELPTRHQACIACGHVWATIDTQALQTFLITNGSLPALGFLSQSGVGVMQGLPDTSQGRALALNIAEFDRLSRSGEDNLVARRFHALMGVTWDQAIAATRNWMSLTHTEKLERLGWITKKPPVDDLAEPLF